MSQEMSRVTTGEPVQIRPMRWWDIPAVATLENALFPTDAWSEEQFWGEIALETRIYLTAEQAGQVIGYAGAFVLAPDSDLQTIAVDPSVQGAGTGRRLLTALMAMVADRGAESMMLEVRADNSVAITLYERMGFERISTRARYYADGTDAQIWRRRPLALEREVLA